MAYVIAVHWHCKETRESTISVAFSPFNDEERIVNYMRVYAERPEGAEIAASHVMFVGADQILQAQQEFEWDKGNKRYMFFAVPAEEGWNDKNMWKRAKARWFPTLMIENRWFRIGPIRWFP